MSDWELKAIELMNQAGLHPIHLKLDGRLHRFALTQQDDKESGWYIGHDETDRLYIVFGDWRSGVTHRYCLVGERVRHEKMQDVYRRLEQLEARAKAEEAIRHETCRIESIRLWNESKPALAHPYLQRKGLTETYGLRIHLGQLLIPVCDASGRLVGLQKISPDGTKRFHPGTKKKGSSFVLSSSIHSDYCLVTEGFATAATVHDLSGGITTACAFDAGNLMSVVTALKENHPLVKIIICADADETGTERACEVAATLKGVEVLVPDVDPAQKQTDFNDFMLLKGREEARLDFMSALEDIKGNPK